MSWEAISTIAEVIGAIAVVVSLVYLAIQLRTNTRAVRANAAWDSEISYAEKNYDIAHAPSVALLAARLSSASSIEDFDETESAQLYFAVRGALQVAQAQWWLWRSGSLPDELWAIRRRWAKNFIDAPAVNAIWRAELEQHIFSEEFAEHIESAERVGELSISTRSS